MNGALAVICTVSMLFIYLLQARKSIKQKDQDDPDRFFLSSGSHSREEYGSTQTAYFLQMATIYPFFLFAFSGMWWLAIWNTIFFAIGIAIFIALLPKFNQSALDLVGNSSTPHALIAAAHKTPSLRLFASFLSITAFIGLALFETVWGTAALKVILGGENYFYYLSIALMTLYLITVLWTGGQAAAIRTAQTQLVIAYIALHLTTAWVISEHTQDLSKTGSPLVFILIFVIGSLATMRRILRFDQDGSSYMKALNAIVIISFVAVLYAIITSDGFFTLQSLKMKLDFPETSATLIAQLFTMACLPIFFQFVDMTNWQRLSSLSREDGSGVASAKDALLFFLIESPLSWLFPIALGLSAAKFLAVASDGDPWIAFIEAATGSSGPFGAFMSVSIVVGTLCIFLSTADGLLSASGYAFAYDISPRTSDIMDRIHSTKDGTSTSEDDRRAVIFSGNVATTIAMIVAVVTYIIVDSLFSLGSGILGLFLTSYAPMLSFAPSILIPILTGRAAHGAVAFSSMCLSAILGIGIGIYSLFSTNDLWQWLGVPVCFLVSWSIYGVGFLVYSRQIK